MTKYKIDIRKEYGRDVFYVRKRTFFVFWKDMSNYYKYDEAAATVKRLEQRDRAEYNLYWN